MTSLSQDSPEPYPAFGGRRGPPQELVLVEEITHRVGNEYAIAVALLRQEARRMGDPQGSGVLNRTAERLERFSRAHQALQRPAGVDRLNLSDYLKDLCTTLSDAVLAERGVRLKVRLDEIVLSPDRCWRVGLIVAELINNAIRHGLKGGAGQILVDVARNGPDISCRVVDDGGGAPVATTQRQGRGRQLVRRLAEDIGGEMMWTFGPGGAAAVLSFVDGDFDSTRRTG